jgi:Xaa-Pro dipeptidase
MMDYAARRAVLAEAMSDVDVVALVPGANMKYFTGLNYHLSERPIVALIGGDQLSLIVPELEVPQVQARPDLEARLFAWTDKDGYQGAYAEAVKALSLRDAVIGVDDKSMRLFELQGFLDADPNIRRRAVGRRLLDVRAHKAPGEIEAMREAAKRSEAAFDALMAWVRPGLTEREIGMKLDSLLVEHGCHGLSFESLVQTGPNSALPHGNVTDRALQEGEFLLIDWGGRYDGYPADLTRTVCLGTPTPEMQKIYDTVLAANRAGVVAAAPGIPCGEVDRAARDVIEAAGYGQYFIHRTGHGLGLEVHELPQMASGVTAKLEVGNVFTIEPGIYVPGLGGVRIEDNVVVTAGGCDVLSSYKRSLSV